ncbi:Vacuolar protein sorting-associated protein 26B [Bulinus truncatus]|nr:Vacuolar protein sorting-associated protein 26B [Bulinus truncatus]
MLKVLKKIKSRNEREKPRHYSRTSYTVGGPNKMSFFGFGQSAEIDIVLDGQENRRTAEIKTEDGKREKYYLYFDGETVSGKVCFA